MRQEVRVARVVEEIMHTGFLLGKPEVYRLEEPGRDGRRILKWILEELKGRAWTGFNWLRIGTSGGLL
jgi:hypothetical protein